jgi:hypothetical protein
MVVAHNHPPDRPRGNSQRVAPETLRATASLQGRPNEARGGLSDGSEQTQAMDRARSSAPEPPEIPARGRRAWQRDAARRRLFGGAGRRNWTRSSRRFPVPRTAAIWFRSGVPQWSQSLGAPVGARPYGQPSESEANVIRRRIPGLTQTDHSSVSLRRSRTLRKHHPQWTALRAPSRGLSHGQSGRSPVADPVRSGASSSSPWMSSCVFHLRRGFISSSAGPIREWSGSAHADFGAVHPRNALLAVSGPGYWSPSCSEATQTPKPSLSRE